MATIPQFKVKQMARRSSSDLDRLASQFRQGVDQLTGEYEASFGQFQRQRAEQLAPFEAEMAQYRNVAMPAYEAAAAQYQQALDAYNAQLKAIEADPVTARTERVMVGRNWYGKKKYADVTVYDPKPIPKFEAVKPTTPTAPTMPQLAEFNAAPFEQRKAALQEQFSRETGERRASRLTAASRKSARPLLQGA